MNLSKNFNKPQWQLPPTTIKLTAAEIHIWQLDVANFVIDDNIRDALSNEEKIKLNKLNPQLQTNFAASRFITRVVLSKYLKLAANEVKFEKTTTGKPQIIAPQNPERISFSISHTEDCILVAVARNCQLGIDIENIDRKIDYIKVAERFFTTTENQTLKSYISKMQKQLFFTIWTAKEAYIKAKGGSIGSMIGKFTVEINEDSINVLDDDNFNFLLFNIAGKYLANLAYSAPSKNIFFYKNTNSRLASR